MSSPAHISIKNNTNHGIRTNILHHKNVDAVGEPINGKVIHPGEERVFKVRASTGHHGELFIGFISTYDESKTGCIEIRSIKDPHKSASGLAILRESIDNFIIKAKAYRNSPNYENLRRVTIDINEPSNNIKIMTYNTHLFAHSAAEIPFWENLTYDDDYRRDRMIEKIRDTNPDIISLEEVWATTNLNSISKDLKNIYPYSYKTPTSAVDPKIGNGLLLLSKFPISLTEKIKFTNLTENDDWSRKGALKARLNIFGNQYIEVISTHLSSYSVDYISNVSQILTQMFKEDDRPFPALLMGDFNMGWEENYNKLKEMVGSKGLVDTFVGIHGEFSQKDIPKYYTTNNQINGLDKVFRPEATGGADRLDYVFYANSNRSNCSLSPIDLTVDHEGWKYNHIDRIECFPTGTTTTCRNLPDIVNMDISDHYPTFVTIKVNRN